MQFRRRQAEEAAKEAEKRREQGLEEPIPIKENKSGVGAFFGAVTPVAPFDDGGVSMDVSAQEQARREKEMESKMGKIEKVKRWFSKS